MVKKSQYIDIEIDKLTKIIKMGLIREPKGIEFYVDPRPLTVKEQKMISDFIKADKIKSRRRKKITTNTKA